MGRPGEPPDARARKVAQAMAAAAAAAQAEGITDPVVICKRMQQARQAVHRLPKEAL